MSRIWAPGLYAKDVAEALRMSDLNWEDFTYSEAIVTRGFPGRNPGFMSPLYRADKMSGIVIGEVRVWDEVVDQRQLYTFVEGGPLHPGGIYLSGYSGLDVVLHKKKRTIDQKTHSERFDLMAHPHFAGRTFLTYYSFIKMRKKTGYTPKLVLLDAHDILDGHPFAVDDRATPNAIQILPVQNHDSM